MTSIPAIENEINPKSTAAITSSVQELRDIISADNSWIDDKIIQYDRRLEQKIGKLSEISP